MTKQERKPQVKTSEKKEPDDFVSVARRLGADESKERFEKKLGQIAGAGSKLPKK